MKKIISILSLVAILLVASYNKLSAHGIFVVGHSENSSKSNSDSIELASPWLIFMNDRCTKCFGILGGEKVLEHLNNNIKISNN